MKIHVLLCSQFIIEATSPLLCELWQILKVKMWYLIDIFIYLYILKIIIIIIILILMLGMWQNHWYFKLHFFGAYYGMIFPCVY